MARTYEELMALAEKNLESIAELREEHKKIAAEQKKTDEQMNRTDEQMKKTDEQMKKTDEQMKKTDMKISRLTENIEGVKKSQGLDAEEFFLSSLEKNPSLGNITFDIVSKQYTKKVNGQKYQMDVFLENGNSVGIVEVKNKAKIEDLDQLTKLMDRFETFYTTHKGMKKYGAIAAKIMPEDVENAALKKGFFVLKQQGNHVEVSSPF